MFEGYLQLAQIALVVCPSYVVFGYNQAGLGGLLNFPSWTDIFPALDTANTVGQQRSHNSTVQGAVVASFTLGALCGSLSCVWIGDYLGRKRTIFLGACISFVGQVLEVSAQSLIQFTIGRVTLGAGVGLLSATVPVWLSECSSADKRGRNVVLSGLFIALGFALSEWVNFGFYHIQDSAASWRGSLSVPFLFSSVIICSVPFLPESPRWLVRKAEISAAKQALAGLRHKPVDSPEIIAEVAGIEISLEDHKNVSLKDVFVMGEDKLFYRFALCVLLQFFQQMSGGTLISAYIPIIFERCLDLGPRTGNILAASAMTWKFLSCFVSFFAIDRIGRRASFMVSGAGMSLCMTAMAVSNSFGADDKSASITSAFFIFLFNFFLPIGFLGANFLYTTEVAPVSLRVAMQAISTANHWLWYASQSFINFVFVRDTNITIFRMFAVAMMTPVALNNIGYRYYIIYAIISGAIPPTVYFFYPETMGQNLEDLDLIFREAPSIRAVVALSKKPPRFGEMTHISDDKTQVEHFDMVESKPQPSP
jgi:sugar porter (SP) family MFS transporter